jgi:hypothetical protein
MAITCRMASAQASAIGPAKFQVFPRDVAEMALAHAIQNKVEAAYRRGDLFEKRRLMMEAWSSYLILDKGQVLGFGKL